MSSRWRTVLTQAFGGILWNVNVKSSSVFLHSTFTKYFHPYLSNILSILDSWVVYHNYNEYLGRLQHERPKAVMLGIILLLVCIAAASVYLWILQQRRRRRYSCENGGPSSQVTRRRSNSYGTFDFEAATSRNRNRSFSNESWINKSPRNRTWSKTLFYNNSSLLGNKVPNTRRRFSSISRPHSSTDVVRDSDVHNESIDDVEFWQTLDQEEEETRMRHVRDRASSKHSAGSKGSSNKVWSSTQSSLRLFGPSVSVIEYSTITPPPTWSKANRKLILSDKAWDLSRIVSLELLSANAFTVGTATLLIEKTKTRSPQQNQNNSKSVLKGSVLDYSVRVHSPPECGVLDIYAKGCDHSEGMEYTFTSTSAAAQFQLDLLALQLVGPSIQNLYSALQIIHKGSSIYIGDEPVLHDTMRVLDDSTGEPTTGSTDESGIAWDDVMRCLGSSFPSIRLRLEAMRWLEVYFSLESADPPTGRQKDAAAAVPHDESKGSRLAIPILNPEYARGRAFSEMDPKYRNRRRLILGPFDFFRLFVPKLSEKALPESDCARSRMEQLLRLRKRVALAAVLVRAYTRAKMVVNQGWNVAHDIQLPEAYWTRRFAFDDDIDNHQYDSTASNEYYEGTVSRDVEAHVRGLNYFKKYSRSRSGRAETPIATSLYQAYSLVGIHSFEWSSDDDSSPLHYRTDPVQSIASIHRLIASHPDMDFFVFSVFLPSQGTAIVHVYVRSLPKGIDPKFDSTVSVDIVDFVIV